MVLLPKTSARTPYDNAIPAGAIVMYENDAVPLLASVLGLKKSKYALMNQRGREVELDADRMHLLPGKPQLAFGSGKERIDYLTSLWEKMQTESRSVDLTELWTVVGADAAERDYEVQELCELYFNDNELMHHGALRIALLEDKIYFKRKKHTFSPRAPEIVDELKKAQLAREEKLRQHDVLVQWGKQQSNGTLSAPPPQILNTLELIEDVALGTQQIDNARQKEAKEVVDTCAERLGLELGGSREQRAFSLLERIHHFTEETNFPLLRYRPALTFSAAALKEAEEIARALDEGIPFKNEPPALRHDFSGLDCFTVDDRSTKDMDDAISFEQHQGGYRLGVHISDVAAAIPPGGALDKEARARATSIYLPGQTINMLPEVLAEDKVSLIVGQKRPCISCLFEIAPDFSVINSTVVPSFITVRRRYHYEEVLHLLDEGDPMLTTIYNIAVSSEERRFRAGAVKVHKREVAVVLEAEKPFIMQEFDEHDPSRSLIAETAVLSNAAFARFAVDRKLPVIFRGQEPAGPAPAHIESIPPGPAFDYAQRARLKKSLISFAPASHASLGLDAYLQCTSPIRRYADLCNQRQLLSYLRTGKARYEVDDLRALVAETEETLGRAISLSRETKRFWALRYLQRVASQGRTIEGTVLRTDLKTPLVELSEVYLPVLVKFDTPVQLGEVVALKIVSIDPRRDYLRLERSQVRAQA